MKKVVAVKKDYSNKIVAVNPLIKNSINRENGLIEINRGFKDNYSNKWINQLFQLKYLSINRLLFINRFFIELSLIDYFDYVEFLV